MPFNGRIPKIEDGAMPEVPGATLAELERYAILKTLAHTGGSTTRAAEILGISPRKIQYRLREYRASGHLEAPRGAAAGGHSEAPSLVT